MIINDIINDTLKRADDNGVLRWSRTSLTMFTAWIAVLWSYHYALIKYGFNETAFGLVIGVALGAKVTDAWSKKMTPDTSKTNEEAK